MGQRGRRSAASLSVIPSSVVEIVPRPEPPDELTDEQAGEWRAIVNRLAADWFPRETHSVLAQYCRHVVAARKVAQLIEAVEQAPTVDVAEYDTLLRMQEREGRALSALATRMRLTQQASYDAAKKKPSQSRKLWEG